LFVFSLFIFDTPSCPFASHLKTQVTRSAAPSFLRLSTSNPSLRQSFNAPHRIIAHRIIASSHHRIIASSHHRNSHCRIQSDTTNRWLKTCITCSPSIWTTTTTSAESGTIKSSVSSVSFVIDHWTSPSWRDHTSSQILTRSHHLCM